jgi:uncharacterized membrane protein YqiK
MIELVLGLAIPAAVLVVAILILGFMFARLYRRSTREVALVKTGTGGRKVIIDGGTLVVPVLHEIMRINMRTMRLEVKREGQSALITKDRLRIDVGAEFYVAVEPTEEGIARAAQTLGARTFDESALREMVEGKLVDGLRGVAATMVIDELHENRSDFVQKVQQAVSEDLKKNGLQLETVSLTALDQTPLEGLDENNIFNALGMQNQAERIAQSKKKRAAIEAEAEVAVARSKQEAAVRTFEIQKAEKEALVNQTIEIAALQAREAAENAKRHEEAEQAAAQARIDRERAVQVAEQARQKAVQIAEQDRARDVEIAEQNRRIAIAEKSEAESQARARADEAAALAVKATESITTAREVAEAERKKQITLLAAEEEAQRAATAIRVAAEAERAAAADRAAALLETARAEAEQITIKAEAHRIEKLAEAEGLRAVNDAENSLGATVIDFRKYRARLDAMPAIIAEMVKPAERIGSITVNRIEGMGGPAGSSGGSSAATMGNPVETVFDEIRRNAIAMPVLNAIGEAVGLNVKDGLAGIIPAEPETPAALPAPANADAPAAAQQPA